MFEAAGLAGGHGQVGTAARPRCSGAPAARGCARRSSDAQRGVPAHAARRRRRAARAAAGRRRRARRRSRRSPTSCPTTSCWPRCATSAATTSARCSRPTRAVRRPTGPRSCFAYTIKGRGLPTEGHPNNHSALLTDGADAAARGRRSAPTLDDPWRALRPRAAPRPSCARPRRERCAATRSRRRPPPSPCRPRWATPHRKPVSTQAALGPAARRPHARRARGGRAGRDLQPRRRLVDQPRRLDQQDRRLVGAATGATGSPTTPNGSCAGARRRNGQHIELGIAEVNLVGLLGELGATWSRGGERLIPIATLYDPFVARALEPWSYGIYAGGQSILVGHAVGRDAGARGRGPPVDHHARRSGWSSPAASPGSRRSRQDLEWASCTRSAVGGRAAPRRTSGSRPAPIDPALAAVPDGPGAAGERRRQAVAGGYRLSRRTAAAADEVTLVGVGAMMPEVSRRPQVLAPRPAWPPGSCA